MHRAPGTEVVSMCSTSCSFQGCCCKAFCCLPSTPFQCVGGCACLRLAPSVQLPPEKVPAQQLVECQLQLNLKAVLRAWRGMPPKVTGLLMWRLLGLSRVGIGAARFHKSFDVDLSDGYQLFFKDEPLSRTSTPCSIAPRLLSPRSPSDP